MVTIMAPIKSLDEFEVIASLLHDVHTLFRTKFNTRAYHNTLKKCRARYASEGIGFLTKTLPAIGKALQRALAGGVPLTAESLRQRPFGRSKLPRLLGELLSEILDDDGYPKGNPDSVLVRSLFDITFVFYKYEIKYSQESEQKVINQFERTESDLFNVERRLETMEHDLRREIFHSRRGRASLLPTGALRRCQFAQCHNCAFAQRDEVCVLRGARQQIQNLFMAFDPTDIHPRHGPGAVSTMEQLWEKYLWTNVARRITEAYPFDAYFCASLGQVCDRYRAFSALGSNESSARVLLVPKDSRGPRLISCEPVDFQWIQQGLGKAITELVESHPLTRGRVNFTNQEINQKLALSASATGEYVTLDLKEASDRNSLTLVRLLFPDGLIPYLEACRSLTTVLPDGRMIKLRKFAPMGSCLCFPIMAISIWAILTAGTPDRDVRKNIYVYGDDVIVPTAYAERAIELLELFGFVVNRDKSCIKGLYRESCGMDAYNGACVTPIRIRTPWSSSRSASSYASWMAYANSYYTRRYMSTYNYIVSHLGVLYKELPTEAEAPNRCAPCLPYVPYEFAVKRCRPNSDYQRSEFRIWTLKAKTVDKELDGWSMLLRYFAEADRQTPFHDSDSHEDPTIYIDKPAFTVRSYTRRKASMLVKRWR